MPECVSYTMSHQYDKNGVLPGKVGVSTLLYGALGLLVAGALDWVGLLGKGDQRILDFIFEPVFRGVVNMEFGIAVTLPLTGVLCFGLAFSVLDSGGMWRRFLLGLTVAVLVLALVPTLALWGIYFPPMVCLVGIFWTWFTSIIYAGHHQMPCDDIITQSTVPYEVPVAVSEPLPEVEPDKVEENIVDEEEIQEPLDPDEKYKPSEV